MPSATAQTAGDTLRKALAEVAGGYRSYATTSAGTSTTFIISGLSGIGSDYVLDMPWALCTTGTNIREFRRATGLSGTTVTVATAYTNAVASGVTVEMYPYRPSLYKQAINRALAKLYPSLYRVVQGHLVAEYPQAGDSFFSVPRNMNRVGRITRVGSATLLDHFNRADSATTAGGGWTATTGTWGISSERLYSVSDADGDLLSYNIRLQDGHIRAILRGTLNSGATYRAPAIAFRIREDYAGAMLTSDYLVVRLLNGVCDLRKVDASSESSLTTGTQTTSDGVDYLVDIEWIGSRINVWVDGVIVISGYQLTGTNLKYLDFPRVAARLDKAGAPATAARVDDFLAFNLTPDAEWTDWKQSADRLTVQLPAFGSTRPHLLLRLDGMAMLTALTADSTTSLASDDATAVVEIATTDEAYLTLIAQARAELFRLLAAEVYPSGLPDASKVFLTLAQDQEADVARMLRMPSHKGYFRHA